MSTDNQNLPKTKSKKKPKSEKPLCTSPKCGPVKVLKEHLKQLAEENKFLKQQLADRDIHIEELEAQLRNLRRDLFGPSSERLHLATKDGVPVEGPADSLDSVCTLPKAKKKKRGAQKDMLVMAAKFRRAYPTLKLSTKFLMARKSALVVASLIGI